MDMLFLDALKGINTQRPPVWLMRQAGRYLPSYRALREKHTLSELFRNSELSAEVALQPIEQFGFDAAIVFSDILVILESLGFSVVYPDKGGPFVENAPKSVEEIVAIQKYSPQEKLHYVPKSIKLLTPHLKVPLLGFCGGPLTIAAYLLDRPVFPDMPNTKKLLWEHPRVMHDLLQKITEVSMEYLDMQIAAGVNAIQVFDSWAGLLSSIDFKQFCLPYLKKLVDAVKAKNIPVILFCRGSGERFLELCSLHPSGISLDTPSDISAIRKIISPGISLQGNLDPMLLTVPDQIEKKTKELLETMKGSKNFIVNLGHGVLPTARVEAVQMLVDTVKSTSLQEAASSIK